MKKLFFALFCTYCVLTSFTKSPIVAQNKPNILVISCEDMSPNLGCYGNNLVKTPNIDRLATEGVRYTKMCTTAGVCAPSRSSLITGMYQTSLGTHNMRTQGAASKPKDIVAYSRVLPPFVKCFPEYLRGAGYFCTNNEKTDYQFEPPITAWDENNNKAHWRDRTDKNQPFFAVFNLMVTHESQVWVRAKQPLEVDPDKVTVPPYYHDSPLVRMDIARNLSNINEMDRQVGKILKELEDDKLLENTIILFFSDHGDGLPFVKREVTNRGILVPFVVRYPQKKGGGTVDSDLHSFVDIPPSILSLTGIKIPKHLQGQAFMGEKAVKTPRKYVFAARDRMDTEYDRVRSVRDKRFQYLKNYYPEKPYYMDVAYRLQQPMMPEMIQLRDAGKLSALQMRWFQPKGVTDELYDLENDPNQFNNLAKKPEYQAKLKELQQALADWTKKYGDWGDMPEKEMIEKQWQNGVQPTTAEPILIEKKGQWILTCPTEGSSIAYKIWEKNEVEPKNWQLYTQPISVKKEGHISATAIRIGFQQSKILTQSYLPKS
jgi:N-sulfoglucosamine sulfohydrolase